MEMAKVRTRDMNVRLSNLPTSPTELQVNHAYRNIEKPLGELAENVKKWLPNLKFVHLDLSCDEGSPG